jgi:hypothetical protein
LTTPIAACDYCYHFVSVVLLISGLEIKVSMRKRNTKGKKSHYIKVSVKKRNTKGKKKGSHQYHHLKGKLSLDPSTSV